MSVSYPLDFFDDFPIKTVKFDLRYRQVLSRDGNNQFFGADLAYPLWTGSFVSAAMKESDCVDLQAVLNSLKGVIEVFLAWDTRREYPKRYPTGAFTDSGTVKEIGVDGLGLSLENLPAGFVISRGDRFDMIFGGKRYLLEAAESVTADGSGITALFDTNPPPPYGLEVAQDVEFKKPCCKMQVEPGSVSYNEGEGLTGTVSWNGIQV